MPHPTGKFQRVTSHPEILAACAASLREGKYSVEATRGDESWREIFPHVMNLLSAVSDTQIKVTSGNYSIMAEQKDTEAIAVVYRTGAPVSKSVRRMLRTALGRRRSDNDRRGQPAPPTPPTPTPPPGVPPFSG